MAADDVDTRNIDAVRREADRIYQKIYPDARPEFLEWACGWFRVMFTGRYKTYQPIDVPYHDYDHTMQGLLCMVRLLEGRHRARAEPVVPRHVFELGILAVLLHDSGYLRPHSDSAGTGAKYTLTHVDRSSAFVEEFMLEQGYTARDITSVQNMIQCTAMNATPVKIPFDTPVERVMGCILATADLMGQMAAADYVERLPQLYREFKESYEYFGERAKGLHFDSADALVANTPDFWRLYVKPKLKDQCDGMYMYLNDPYPDGDNEYLERIEANIRNAARLAGGNTGG